MAKSEIAERIDGQRAVEVSTPSHQIAARAEDEAASQRRALRSLALSNGASRPMQPRRPARAPAPSALVDERRRLERALHDGVQNELVALMIKLALVQEDPKTPTALAETLAGLEARAQAALGAVRNIVRGSYPPLLADFGLARALHARAARAVVDVRLIASAPRGTEAAEEAVYFTCSEAIQNAAKYAGGAAKITLRLRHKQESLAVRIADDGRGFDPAHTRMGTGLHNIRDRVEDLGGTVHLASGPGRGTVLTVSMPWAAAADRRR